MQTPRRTNRDRTDATRAALMEAGRALFVAKGYGETSTPEIVAAAGVTRGALYHHFEDKRALFRAVVADEAAAVAEDIERSAPRDLPAVQALLAGADAYLAAMRQPGRTRLLLIEGPAVLGAEAMRTLDEETAARTLREGLEAAGGRHGAPLAALGDLLSAAFDRAALTIESGADPRPYRDAIEVLVRAAAA